MTASTQDIVRSCRTYLNSVMLLKVNVICHNNMCSIKLQVTFLLIKTGVDKLLIHVHGNINNKQNCTSILFSFS